MRKITVVFLIAFSFMAAVEEAYAADKPGREKIRLILQITVDGLRADMIERYGHHFGEDGFRRLLGEGVVFSQAHYQHANTETIVGHATLSTGSHPAQHGVVGNVWYDRASGELAYNIEDPEAPILPTREETRSGEQVDPAQQAARTEGRSPRALLVPTLADTLAVFTAGGGKAFAISGKDRSAVAMAGKTGKAFWQSTDTGDFVTSAYYYDEYPAWVIGWNGERKPEGYAGKQWELLHEKDSYLLAAQDDRPYETDLKGYGRTFPHPFGEVDNPLFVTRLVVSPVGDRLLLDFAQTLLVSEQLGKDEVVDYFSISFSGVDAINHFFGPSSLENEDVVAQLDRTLADLFAFLDKEVGLDKTLIVLCSDHGMAEMPEYLTELGHEAGRLYSEDLMALAETATQEQYGVEGLIKTFFRPSLYLDGEKIAAAGLDRDEVARTLAEALTGHEGIALAVPTSGLSALETSPALERIRRNYHPERSGDIYVAQAPYWFLFEKGPAAAMHGSPWAYDTHVPLIFLGPGLEPATVHRHVRPVDVAPTLAAWFGMTPPAAATGVALEEAHP